MNTAIARARTQSGARFCITVVIKDMIAVHAIPPNKMATDRSATDLNAATPQSDPAKTVVPSASSASDENNERVRCSAQNALAKNIMDPSRPGQNLRRVSRVPKRRADRTGHGLSQRAWLVWRS